MKRKSPTVIEQGYRNKTWGAASEAQGRGLGQDGRRQLTVPYVESKAGTANRAEADVRSQRTALFFGFQEASVTAQVFGGS